MHIQYIYIIHQKLSNNYFWVVQIISSGIYQVFYSANEILFKSYTKDIFKIYAGTVNISKQLHEKKTGYRAKLCKMWSRQVTTQMVVKTNLNVEVIVSGDINGSM